MAWGGLFISLWAFGDAFDKISRQCPAPSLFFISKAKFGDTSGTKNMIMKKRAFLIKQSIPGLGVDESKGIIYINNEQPISFYNEYILISTHAHNEIFKGKKKGDVKYIKITNPRNDLSINKLCRSISAKDFTQEDVALTRLSMYQLGLSREIGEGGVEVEIEKINLLSYYWNHQSTATRIATKLGVLSFVLGSISAILGIVSFF